MCCVKGDDVPGSIDEGIGIRIREARIKKKMTRNQLSEAIDKTYQFMGSIETGKKSLSLATLCSIASVLNVTTDYILFGHGDAEGGLDYASQSFASLSDVERECAEAILDKVVSILRKPGNEVQ